MKPSLVLAACTSLILSLHLPAHAQATSDLGALNEYADMMATNAACKTLNIDHSDKIEKLLAAKLEFMTTLATNQSVSAAARQSLNKVIDKTRRKDYDKARFDTVKREFLEAPAEKLTEVCTLMPKYLENEFVKVEIASRMSSLPLFVPPPQAQ